MKVNSATLATIALAASAVLLAGSLLWLRRAPTVAASPGDLMRVSARPGARVETSDLQGTAFEAPFARPPRTSTHASGDEAPDAIDLPDPATALTERIDALRRAAQAGSPRAACHLLVETLVCGDLQRNRGFRRDMRASLERGMPAASEDRVIDMLASAAAEGVSDRTRCKGFDPDAVGSLDEYLQSALAHMSVHQKVILAMVSATGRIQGLRMDLDNGDTRFLGSGGGTEQIYPQFLADHSEDFLREGIRAGDPLALEGMVLMHLPALLPILSLDLRVQRPDPYRFAGYALVLRELHGAEALGPIVPTVLERVLATLAADTRTQLDAAVAREVRRWRALPSTASSPPALRRDATAEQICAE